MMNMTIRILFFSILLSLNSLYAATFVNSEDDFFVHMKNHVQNVRALADSLLELAEKDPEIRSNLGLAPGEMVTPELKKLTQEFLGIHDASKINTSKEFLQRYGASEPMIKELYGIYGKTFAQMTEAEKNTIQNLINGTDAKERNLFIQSKKPTPQQMAFMDQIEKLTDGVERGSNPVTSEEMAKKILTMTEIQEKDLAKATTAEEIAQIKKKIKISKMLEQLYPKVTTSYLDYKDKAVRFKDILKKTGIATDYLDKYSLYQMMSDYEDAKGKTILKSNDLKLLENDYKKFLFENEGQFKKVQSMVKSASTIEGLMMLDFGKIEHNKINNIPYQSRYNRLYETLAGECAN